jgi:hypothetical protein
MRLKSFNLLKAASMRHRSLYRRLLKLNRCFLLERFGMTGLVPCSSRSARSSLLSYALSPSRHLAGSTRQIRRSASGPSCASPPVNRMAIRRPSSGPSCASPGQQDGDKASFSICECMDLRVAPSARTANSLLFLPPFPPAAERWAFTWVESIICMSADRPFPASSRNRFSQMPRRAHRTNRL